MGIITKRGVLKKERAFIKGPFFFYFNSI